jgi:heterodisulfide reductase subunit C
MTVQKVRITVETLMLTIKYLAFLTLQVSVFALIGVTLTAGLYLPTVRMYQRFREKVRALRRKATIVPEAVRQAASACMQCGTCTGSCVAAPWMDYGPRRIFALLASHQDSQVLSSQTIWTCANCYTCTVRCPRDIPITYLMGKLRQEAIDQGYWPQRDVDYNRSFLNIVRRYGHVFETALMVALGLADPAGLLAQTPEGLRMLSKGKLALAPHRIKGREELERIFAHYDKR